MAAIASLSELVNLASGGGAVAPEHLFFEKIDRLQGGAAPATLVAGRLHSLWGWAGSPAGVDVAGTPPGAASNPTNATDGTLKQADAGGTRQKWLTGIEAVATQVGALVLYDRLLQMSGLDGTLTTAQTVGGTLSRITGGDGVKLWLEIYTAIGATATTVTASYTNQAGTSGRTTPAAVIGGAGWNEAGRIIPLPLQAGDTGVRSVQSVTLAATTGTAGNFGVTLSKPITFLGIPQAGPQISKDFISGYPALPEIIVDAALALAWLTGSTIAPQIYAAIHSVEK